MNFCEKILGLDLLTYMYLQCVKKHRGGQGKTLVYFSQNLTIKNKHNVHVPFVVKSVPYYPQLLI